MNGDWDRIVRHARAIPNTTSVVIPAFNEGRPSARSSRTASARGLARDSRRRRWIERRHGGARARRRRARHPAPVQQGQRRGGQDRHPQRDGRSSSSSSTPTASTGRPTRCGSSPTWTTYDLVVGARSTETQANGAAVRQCDAELDRQLSDRAADSGPHVGIPSRAPRVPRRVPAPAAERLLDADDDDAGVHEGGLQRALRADRGGAPRGRVEDPPRRRRRRLSC